MSQSRVSSSAAAPTETTPPQPGGRRHGLVVALLSRIPIHHRILSATVVLVYLGCIGTGLILWSGLQRFTAVRVEFAHLRSSDQLLTRIDGTVYHLNSLIHRYFTNPDSSLLQEIVDERDKLIDLVNNKAPLDNRVAGAAKVLAELTQVFLRGFDDLRDVQTALTTLHDQQIQPPLRNMESAYATLEDEPSPTPSALDDRLRQSRAAYGATLLALNTYYLSNDSKAATIASDSLKEIRSLIPRMQESAGNDLERNTIDQLCIAADALNDALTALMEKFNERQHLLYEIVDGTQVKLTRMTAALAQELAAAETAARQRGGDMLGTTVSMLILFALVFIGIATPLSAAIARSVSAPLRDLGDTMQGIVAGHLTQRVRGTEVRDEIGEMARSVEIFRHDAIAKRRAEEELRASRDRAERTLSELRATQENLLQAEKLAALGGLVAGVAHEVNNPVGISLTVATTLARRVEDFRQQIQDGPVRRSALNDFIAMNGEAAEQLVTNLERAGQLIQSFKQVAVDRNQGERRVFDLAESTEQIITSLRPQLKRYPIRLEADIPPDITMDSYPGAYGQVLTNLYLNAVTHAFPHGRAGVIRLIVRRPVANRVEVVFADNGQGMTDAVQKRAFEPFFTTRRGEGGTGLGLHIIYNIVTQKLGGRITLTSALGEGTTFRLILPTTAPEES